MTSPKPHAPRLSNLAYPCLDPETPVLDIVPQWAKRDGADLVSVVGKMAFEKGRFARGQHDSRRCRRRAFLEKDTISSARRRGENFFWGTAPVRVREFGRLFFQSLPLCLRKPGLRARN